MITIEGFILAVFAFGAGLSLGMMYAAHWRRRYYVSEEICMRMLQDIENSVPVSGEDPRDSLN